MDEEILFTSAAILDLLSQIDELADKDLRIDKTIDNKIQLTIGSSVYEISNEPDTTIEVSDETVDDINEATVDAYQELLDRPIEYKSDISEDNNSVTQIPEDAEPIQGGIIKEAIKSLLLGGMIRFAKNRLL